MVAGTVAELARLDEAGIDAVLAGIEGERLGYRALYYRWEQEQWEAGALDLVGDAAQWADLSPELRRSLSWWITALSAGAEETTNALVAFVDAAATEEQGVFLTTQLVDEARRAVFFDRVLADTGADRGVEVERRLERRISELDPSTNKVFFELLPAAAARIRGASGGAQRDALIEAVTLCQLLIEGTLELSAIRALHRFTHSEGLLPAFRRGLIAVARDSSRHVAFALSFLHEAVGEDQRHAASIASAVETHAPAVIAAFDPASHDPAAYEGVPFGPEELRDYALSALSRRLEAIGVDVDV